MPTLIVQKIEKNCVTDIELAIKYYTVLFSLNNIYPSIKEVELLAFTAVRGTISSTGARREFVEKFTSSPASMENIKCRLVKKSWLVKVEGKIKINPKLGLDFTGDVLIQIKLYKDYDKITSEPASGIREVESISGGEGSSEIRIVE